MPKSLPEITSELNISVGHNGLRQTMQFNDAIEKDFGHSEASEVREQGRKWAILEKRSPTTKTESYFLRWF